MAAKIKSEDFVEGEFDENWFENLALIEILTREKGYKEGYKIGEQEAAAVGLSTGAEVAPGPGYEYGCLYAFSRAFLEEQGNKVSETKEHEPSLKSLITELAQKTETDPGDILQIQRDLNAIRLKIELYETQYPILKALRPDNILNEPEPELSTCSQSSVELY